MGFITITQQKIENQTDSKNSNEKEIRKSSVYSFTGILEIKANSWKKSEIRWKPTILFDISLHKQCPAIMRPIPWMSPPRLQSCTLSSCQYIDLIKIFIDCSIEHNCRVGHKCSEYDLNLYPHVYSSRKRRRWNAHHWEQSCTFSIFTLPRI